MSGDELGSPPSLRGFVCGSSLPCLHLPSFKKGSDYPYDRLYVFLSPIYRIDLSCALTSQGPYPHLVHLFTAESDLSIFLIINPTQHFMNLFPLVLSTLKQGALRRTFANRRWMSVRPMIFQSGVHSTRKSLYLLPYPSHNADTHIQCPRGKKLRFNICTRCAELARRLPCSPHMTSPPHVRSIPTALTSPSLATPLHKSVSDCPLPPDSPSTRCYTIPEPSRAAPRIRSS